MRLLTERGVEGREEARKKETREEITKRRSEEIRRGVTHGFHMGSEVAGKTSRQMLFSLKLSYYSSDTTRESVAP